MEFQFDPAKSDTNLDKHDIDFDHAQMLWDDPSRLEVPARTVDEQRWLILGVVDGKHWPAVVTYREDKIRSISVRRSHTDSAA